MVGEPEASIGRPDALLVLESSGALTLLGAFPFAPPIKSQVLPEQNALLPGPVTVKVLSVKDEKTAEAFAANGCS